MTGQNMCMSVGGDPRDDSDQHVLTPTDRNDRLQPVDVVGPIDHDESDPVVHRQR
jgi:hypothetical protein